MELKFLSLFQSNNQSDTLGGRYKIISELGAGGFGKTFVAEDLHLPGHPQCVLKQLKPQVSDAKSLQMARRLFDTEAQVLYQLGNHDQIPRLLAHFEDNQEFFLAQELIEGKLLSKELVKGKPCS
ncbi:MAG: protein kinase, partial [Symploca sp. SIO2D2]|nr:protein kinase [Symploca sp. SIO2D2]